MTGRKIGKLLAERGIYVRHMGIGWKEWRHFWTLWNHEHEWEKTKPEEYITSVTEPGAPKSATCRPRAAKGSSTADVSPRCLHQKNIPSRAGMFFGGDLQSLSWYHLGRHGGDVLPFERLFGNILLHQRLVRHV